jgi:hypothetical protein
VLWARTGRLRAGAEPEMDMMLGEVPT